MPPRVYTAAHASVRFAALDLDPLQVTLRLRLPPDHQHRRGEPRLSRSARTGRVTEYSPYAQGIWWMSSEAWVHSPKLATHIEWLLRELEPRAALVHAFLASGVEGDIFCYSSGRTRRPPSLPRQLHDRAQALGLRIDIDHYADVDDEGVADGAVEP